MNRFVVVLAAALAAPALAQQATSPQTQAALEQARQLEQSGDAAGAEAAYRQLIQTDPASAVAHNKLGMLLYKQRRAGEAIEQFQVATQDDPTYALAWFNLGFAARKNNRCAEAIPAYQRYTQLAPNDPDGLWGLAECYRTLGQVPDACAQYAAYARLETRPSEKRYIDQANGWIGQRCGGAPAAAPPPAEAPAPAPALAAVPAPSPASPAAADIAKGDAFLAQNDLKDGLYAYQDAVRAAPNDAIAHFKVGVAYARLGYYPQAIDEWNRVLAIDPTNQGAKENIRKAEARMGAAAPAPAVVPAPTPASPAPAPMDPVQAQALAAKEYGQAVGLIKAGRYQEATAALGRAITARPDFAVAYVARGSAEVGLGRFHDAVQDYLKGLSLNGNQAAPLFGLGEAYRGMGDRSRAAQYYQECANSTAPDAAALRDLARKQYSDLLTQP